MLSLQNWFKWERKKMKKISQTNELEMVMQQKLSPHQILLTKLLQIPIVDLEHRIEQEIEENPALEFAENEDNASENEIENNLSDELPPNDIAENGNPTADEDADAAYEDLPTDTDFNFDDYFNEDDTSEDYTPSALKEGEENYFQGIIHSSNESFQESLFSQLGMFELSEEDRKIAVFLIGSIDESGYLTRSCEDMKNDLLFTANINTTVEHLKEIIANVVHKLEPSGVGATDLQQCLLLQLERFSNTKDEAVRLAYLIVKNHFVDFTKKRFEHIKKSLSCSNASLEQATAVLLKLNPKPGATFSASDDTACIIPDFIVSINEKTQEIELSLQKITLPELRVGRAYQRLYNELKTKTSITDKDRKDAMDFVRQKVNAAKWFIDALSQRDQTLYKTMDAIIHYQKEFFLSGEEITLKPMVLKDIATRIDMDVSTISRVVRLKYVLTPYGVYPLKFFFSESMLKDDGEEVSVYKIKKIIAGIIEKESEESILTDTVLCNMLKEMGYNIARRTVAKYREQLGFSVARLRK
jgi:RNA polymerase sigma-54 factor